jgi:hypothetical protein
MKKVLFAVFLFFVSLFFGCATINPAPGYVDVTLNKSFAFNYQRIDSFTAYAYQADDKTVEKYLSFAIDIGPSFECKGNVYPAYRVPKGKMVLVQDWSFDSGPVVSQNTTIGGTIGRITANSRFIYGIMCGIYAGQEKGWNPGTPIRYLPGEWIAVCLQQWGEKVDTRARATFKFVEVPASAGPYKIEIYNFHAGQKRTRIFDGIEKSELWP